MPTNNGMQNVLKLNKIDFIVNLTTFHFISVLSVLKRSGHSMNHN